MLTLKRHFPVALRATNRELSSGRRGGAGSAARLDPPDR